MIGFRDRTFCSAVCRTKACSRRWTSYLQACARRWYGSDDAPVAFANFAPSCGDYDPPGDHGLQLDPGAVNV